MNCYLKTCCFTCLSILVATVSGYSQTWHQQVDYQIDIRVDDKAQTVQGRERVSYNNHSRDTLKSVFFRLAWQDRAPQVSAEYKVYAVQQNGIAIDFAVHTSQPDPAIPPQSLSQTLLEIQLSRPLLPGDGDVYTIAWQADIPVFSGGCGKNSPSGVDYTFTNWYPQACVYDAMGWHLGSPFEPDFSSEFGSYKVEITLPQKYMVAATGVLTNADAIGYGYEKEGSVVKPNYGLVTVWKFQATQVRDFAWAADPDLKHEKKQWRDGLTLHAFYFKNENQLASLETVLSAFERMAVPYRHPQLSVIQMGEMRAELPMLVFAGTEVPQLDPAISWGFQEMLLENTFLQRQFRYVIGDEAFKKGLNNIFSRYQYGRLPTTECIHLFERSSGLELDWLWDQYKNTRNQVDYGIRTVKSTGENVTSIEIQRVKGAVLPVVLEITYTDGVVEQHYIPVDLLRAKLPLGSRATAQPVWQAGEKNYILKLAKPLGLIKSLVIDPEVLMGDMDRRNNRKEM